MKKHLGIGKGSRWLLLLAVIIVGVAAAPLFTSACRTATSVAIVNNSSREFRHLYFSAVDQNNWGPDQLNGSVISPGDNYTVNAPACDGASVKVIVEDQNGCFLYQTVACGQSSSWTITNDAAPDCGN